MKYAPIIYTQSHLYTHQIPDIVESLLSNNSTFVKFAEWALNNDIKLWRAYNWTIVYFYSIRNHISFADNENLLNDSLHGKDEIKTQIKEWEDASPHNKSCAENTTEWLRDEFNPLITESMPPVITQFAAVSDVGFFYAYTKVSVELRDPSGIGTIRLISKPEKNLPLIYDIRIFNANGATIWSIKNLKLNITADAAAYHYFVVCNASDSLGNTAQWTKKVNGPVGAFVDTVAKLLSALWGFLCEVGETLAKAVSILIEWVKDLIEKALDALIGPVKQAINSFVSEFQKIIDEINTGGVSLHKVLYDIEGLLIGHSPPHILMVYLLALAIGFITLELVLSVFIAALGGGVILNLISEEIFKNLVGQVIKGAIAVTAGLTIATLIPLILDKTNPAWQINTGLGISVLDLIMAAGTSIYSWVARAPEYVVDVFGLLLSLGGLILTISGAANTFLGAAMAAIISGVGIIVAVKGTDLPGIVGKFDEAIDIVCFAFTAYNAAKLALGGESK